MTLFYFPTKYHFFHNFVVSCSNYTFYTNHALKFQYQPSHLKINDSIIVYKGPIFANLSLRMAAVSDVGSSKKWRVMLKGVVWCPALPEMFLM